VLKIFENKQGTPFAGGTLSIKHAYKSSVREKEKDSGPVRRQRDRSAAANPFHFYPTQDVNSLHTAALLSQISSLFSQGLPTALSKIDPSQLQALSLLYNQQSNIPSTAIISQTGTIPNQNGIQATVQSNQQPSSQNYNQIPQQTNYGNYLPSNYNINTYPQISNPNTVPAAYPITQQLGNQSVSNNPNPSNNIPLMNIQQQNTNQQKVFNPGYNYSQTTNFPYYS